MHQGSFTLFHVRFGYNGTAEMACLLFCGLGCDLLPYGTYILSHYGLINRRINAKPSIKGLEAGQYVCGMLTNQNISCRGMKYCLCTVGSPHADTIRQEKGNVCRIYQY